jgi:hypothetical protein
MTSERWDRLDPAIEQHEWETESRPSTHTRTTHPVKILLILISV